MPEFDPNFLCGATRFTDQALQEARIVIPLKLAEQDVLIWAVVDTAATYSVLASNVATELEINSLDCPDRMKYGTKWGPIIGRLCRLPVRLESLEQYGEGIDLEASFFIPDSGESWESDLNFIGLQTFLLAIRFAIDPHPDKMLFYFGGLV